MKKIAFYLGVFSLSIIGGIIGQTITHTTEKEVNINQTLYGVNKVDNKNVKTVALANENLNIKNQLVDLTYASNKAVKSVVHIQTHFVREQIVYDPFLQLFYGENAYKIRERHGQASGSGVIISDDGYIVTNNHVVQDAKEIMVTLNHQKFKGKLVGTDPSTDLAVIKINAKGLDYLKLANSDDLNLGEWVLAVGNPLNLQSTVTAGIVSAKNRNIDLLTAKYNPKENIFPVESFIQTDAAVNSGNSGGALVNVKGELVGINTAIASGNGFYTGYSFAVPSNIVKKVTSDLIKYGKVVRVQLGVNLIENNSDFQSKLNFITSDGVIVLDVIANGNGFNAGLKSNDIIIGVDNKKINSLPQLQEVLLQYQPGDVVPLKIVRGQLHKQINVLME
ncbi:MAG TPA: trypsin-like serine protease [Crocinitomix sp.]|nr:trypsin-like serine protease [Crocinitomix sp.]